MQQDLIPEDSPLRRPPSTFSRRQVLVLDGIRYAAEMAHIAYERLSAQLQHVAASSDEPRVHDIAAAMLDAWSIVDSAHRFRDLVQGMPGLPNSTWKRVLCDRTDDVAALRNSVQHQLGEIDRLLLGGQLGGYLSWAKVKSGHYTGKWLMMSAGAVYERDEWLFIGPIELPFEVPLGRIRLNAFDRKVYLGRTVGAIATAVSELATAISNGSLRPVGEPAAPHGADLVYEGFLEILTSVDRTPKPA